MYYLIHNVVHFELVRAYYIMYYVTYYFHTIRYVVRNIIHFLILFLVMNDHFVWRCLDYNIRNVGDV
jgi:hypothetical protein